MQIITGKTGTNHVSAEDDRGKHAGIFGKDEYVLNVGNIFSASVESANTIRLASGDGVMQGTHFRIPHGKYDDVTIDNGTTGYMRKDLIVARYKKVGDIESVTSVVLKGTPVASDPQAPEYTQGNILEGASFSEMPLYEVLLDGVNIVSVTSLFKVWTGFDDVYRKEEVDAQEEVLQTKIEAVQSSADNATKKAEELSVELEGVRNNVDNAYIAAQGARLPVGSIMVIWTGSDNPDFGYGVWEKTESTFGVSILADDGSKYTIQCPVYMRVG